MNNDVFDHDIFRILSREFLADDLPMGIGCDEIINIAIEMNKINYSLISIQNNKKIFKHSFYSMLMTNYKYFSIINLFFNYFLYSRIII